MKDMIKCRFLIFGFYQGVVRLPEDFIRFYIKSGFNFYLKYLFTITDVKF